MQQLTTKENEIYKDYIFEQIAKNFKDLGTIDIEYLKIVIDLKYEISDVTKLIYPTINFRDSFEKLKTLSKIKLNHKPNNLFDHYKIETIKVPTFYTRSRENGIFTPYDNFANFKNYINESTQPRSMWSHAMYSLYFEYSDVTILTNGDQKEFDFLDENENDKKYLLPINYEKNKSLELYQQYRDIKKQIRNIVENIKPIDNEKLYELVINHYKNV